MTTEPSIFTKIINRDIPADIVYEDATVIAFLTIEPINPGHTLVVPKIPFVNILDGDEQTMGQMMLVAKKIGNALIAQGLGTGVNLIMNNGESANQEVFHAHLHIVPRLPGDGAFEKPKHIPYAPEQATTIAHALQAALM